MAERFLTPEWRRQNGTTKYPFAERATLRSDDDRLLLEGTFLDASLYPVGARAGVFLSRVDVTHEDVTLVLGDAQNLNLASAAFDLVAPPDLLAFTDTSGRPAGVIVSEGPRLGLFQSWGVGSYAFRRTQSEFAATVVIPTPEMGVRAFVLADGTLFAGDVYMIGDDGVVLRTEDVLLPATSDLPERIVQTIRVDIVGDPLFRRRLCNPANLFQAPAVIKALRVVSAAGVFDVTPNERGAVVIQGNDDLASDTVLRVTNGAEGLIFQAVGSDLGQPI